MPRVSIIIPNFNHAQFLEQRLDSVLNQTFQDFEIIYLDDGSTDESAAVFAKVAGDPRIRAVVNQANGGNPFKQWNKGVGLATGEYIWIAESDDHAERSLLTRLVEVLDRNPSVGLAYCNSVFVDDQLHVEDRTMGGRSDTDFVNEGKDECRRQLLFNNTIPNASAVVFRRELYEKVGYADEAMRFCGDWLQWVKMLLISDVAFLSDYLNFHNCHSASVTSTIGRSLLFAEERYRIVRYLKGNLELDHAGVERVRESVVEMWSEFLVSRAGRKTWRLNRRVYRAARAVDPWVELRLLKRLVILGLTKLRLIDPALSCLRFVRRILPLRRAHTKVIRNHR